MNRRRQATRGFTIIEVLLSVTLFAIAVIVLAGAYVNVITGVESVRTDRAFEQEVRWVRDRVLSQVDMEKVEEGGEVESLDFGRVQWEVTVQPTALADVFSIEMRMQMDGAGEHPAREWTETFLVLRPQWSEPLEREKLRTEARERIEESRRRQGVISRKGS